MWRKTFLTDKNSENSYKDSQKKNTLKKLFASSPKKL